MIEICLRWIRCKVDVLFFLFCLFSANKGKTKVIRSIIVKAPACRCVSVEWTKKTASKHCPCMIWALKNLEHMPVPGLGFKLLPGVTTVKVLWMEWHTGVACNCNASVELQRLCRLVSNLWCVSIQNIQSSVQSLLVYICVMDVGASSVQNKPVMPLRCWKGV